MSTVARDWVDHYALRRPDAIALVDGDTGEKTSWSQLDEQVGRVAGALVGEIGLRRGDRLAVLTATTPRVFVLQFACFRAGLVFTPLNWRLAVPELAYMCTDAGARVLVADGVWESTGREVAEAASIEKVISDGELWSLAGRSRAIGASGNNTLDQPCQILYTSGTTGFPKGAISTFGTLMWNAFNGVQPKGYANPGVHLYNPLPLFHAGGLNSSANPILFFGGQVTTASKFDPAAALQALTTSEPPITHLALVPVMYQAIANQPGFDRADLSALRIAVVAGGLAPVTLLRRFAAKGVRLEPHYGGTEMGPSVMALSPPDQAMAEAGSVGRPVQHTEVRLVDEEGRDVPAGQPGEVWIKGPSVTPGYWGKDSTGYFTDGWFRTGDVARMDENGYYFLVDRVKDMYKSGGENVYPAEVERALLEHPSVSEVAVIGIPDAKWGEVGLAVVVPSPGAEVTMATLEEALAGKLARYKFPKALQVVDALLRNVTGKVAKDELRAKFGGSSVA